MSKLQIMDHSGHTTMEFDSATKDGVSEAMQKFNELISQQRLGGKGTDQWPTPEHLRIPKWRS